MINWDAAGAIAEGLGALAVILTLIYLSLQVRHAKLVAADSNRLVRATGVREMTLAMLHNDDMRASTIKALNANAYYEDSSQQLGISLLDADRIDWVAQYYFWLHWGQFSTTMTASDRIELEHIILQFYTLTAIKHSWNQNK